MVTSRGSLLSSVLSDRQWWRQVWQAALKFAPRCWRPAAALTGANILVTLTTGSLTSELAKLQAAGAADRVTATDIWQAFAVALVCFVSLIASLVITLVALSNWLVKLTVFSRLTMLPEMVGAADPESAINQAFADMKKKHGYLMRVWTVASLILLLPAIPLCVCVALRVLATDPFVRQSLLSKDLAPQWQSAMSALLGPAAQHLPNPQALVDQLQTVGFWGALLFTVIIVLYSFVTVALSAVSEPPASATALAALSRSFHHALPLLALTIVVLLVNSIISAPESVISLIGLKTEMGTAGQVAGEIWIGLTSIYLWPLSMAPFCKFVLLTSSDDK